MPYRLSLTGDIPQAVRATIADELASAIRRLSEGTADPVEAIHGARKNLKKSRALLRLVRADLPGSVYREENAGLRNAGRSVAAVRDADVMVATLDTLGRRFDRGLPDQHLTEVRRALSDEAEGVRSGLDRDLQAGTLEELRSAAQRAARWPAQDIDTGTLRRGITTAYRRGRRAFEIADDQPSAENLHDWRKRVKDLWYQHRLLADAWPAVLAAQGEQAHKLSELLGDDHDLAVLAQRLVEPARAERLNQADVAGVLELVQRRRRELLTQARDLGERLYAERPSAFADRMGRYLALTRRQAATVA